MATVTWLSRVSYYARPWCIHMIAFLTWARLEAVTPSTARPASDKRNFRMNAGNFQFQFKLIE